MSASILLIAALLAAPSDLPETAAAKEAKAAVEAEKRKFEVQVKKLVVKLDDDSQDVRDQAEKDLVDLGEGVLEIMPKPDEENSSEVKARLENVRRAVEKNAVESYTKPTKLTLKGEMKLSEAFNQIARQTGNKLIDFRERFNQEAVDAKVQLDINEQGFWKGLDEFLDVAQLKVYNFSDDEGGLPIVLKEAKETPRLGRAHYGGLFRLEATSVSATRNLQRSEAGGLRILADLAWEPRVRPIVINVPLADMRAVDENGGSIAVDSDGELEIPVETGNAALQLDFNLALPSRTTKKIASLKGKITALVPGRAETFEFRNLPKAKSDAQQRAGVTVTLEQMRKNEEADEIRLRVRYDRAASALDSHRGWIDRNEAYLLDPKGNRIDYGGLERWLADESEVGFSYIFDLEGIDPAKCKFIYKTPAAIYTVPAEFELTDIELP